MQSQLSHDRIVAQLERSLGELSQRLEHVETLPAELKLTKKERVRISEGTRSRPSETWTALSSESGFVQYQQQSMPSELKYKN